MSRIGAEHLTSNRYVAHPFQSSTVGLTPNPAFASYGVDAILPMDAILDAVVVLSNSENGEWALQRILEVPAGFDLVFGATPTGPVLSVVTIPTIPEIYAAMVSGYYVVDVADTTTGFALRAVCDGGLVQYLEGMVDADGFSDFNADINGLRFSGSVVELSPPKVSSISIYSDMTTEKTGAIVGDVSMIPGYNVGMDIDDKGNDTTDVMLYVSAGLGAGTVPCDEVTNEDLTIVPMNLEPDPMGAIRLVGDDCYEFIPDMAAGSVAIHGVCYSCCDCSDYEAVGEALRTVMDRTHNTRLALDASNNMHTALANDFMNALPNVQRGYYTLTAVKGSTGNANSPANHGSYAFRLSNRSNYNIITSTIDFLLSPSAALLRGVYRVTSGVSGSMITHSVPPVIIAPGESLLVEARVNIPGVPNYDGEGELIDVTLTALSVIGASGSYSMNGATTNISVTTGFS